MMLARSCRKPSAINSFAITNIGPSSKWVGLSTNAGCRRSNTRCPTICDATPTTMSTAVSDHMPTRSHLAYDQSRRRKQCDRRSEDSRSKCNVEQEPIKHHRDHSDGRCAGFNSEHGNGPETERENGCQEQEQDAEYMHRAIPADHGDIRRNPQVAAENMSSCGAHCPCYVRNRGKTSSSQIARSCFIAGPRRVLGATRTREKAQVKTGHGDVPWYSAGETSRRPENRGVVQPTIMATKQRHGSSIKMSVYRTDFFAWMLPFSLIFIVAMNSAQASGCAFEVQGEGRVSAVIDARSFRLDDGREVRLAGIEPADKAKGRRPVVGGACWPRCDPARRGRHARSLRPPACFCLCRRYSRHRCKANF